MDTTVEANVLSILHNSLKAFQDRDVDEILSYFAPSSTVMIYGTGADEKRVGLEQIRYQIEQDLAQSESFDISFDWSLVASHGSVSWIAADVTISVKLPGYDDVMVFPARLTAVARDYDGKLLFEQWHLSTPAVTQAEGESF